jgi:hypothetical protein
MTVFLLSVGILLWIFPDTSFSIPDNRIAALDGLFIVAPWLFLFLIPAISMRLWSEERRQGTIELFLTLPISIGEAVTAKFLAAWAFVAIALALTFPIWITVNVMGDPDNGIILAEAPYNFELANYDDPPHVDVTQLTKLELPKGTFDASALSILDIQRVAHVYEGLFNKVVYNNEVPC